MALNGLIQKGVPSDWATHMIGHELTALYEIDHARTLAIIGPNLYRVMFDSKKEKFKFKTESLKNGTHVLILRVKDAAGNTGSGDVVFTLPARKQLP